MKYVIDPLFFALDPDCDEVTYLRFVSKLAKWRRMIANHPNDVYKLSSTMQLLIDENLYPTKKQFTTQFVQQQDLDQTMFYLLGKSHDIDKATKPLWQDTELKRISCSDKPTRCKDEFDLLLYYTLCHSKIERRDIDAYVLFHKDISSDLQVDLTYRSFQIKNEEFVERDHKVTFGVKCLRSISDFLKDEKIPSLIWKDAQCKEDIDYGVRVMLCQVAGLKELNEAYTKFNCYIQESFFDNFCKSHYATDETILRRGVETLAHILLGINNKLEHSIRTGAGGNNPPLVLHDYHARRRNITTSIKVSYWKKGNEFWFANIKEHDNFFPDHEF